MKCSWQNSNPKKKVYFWLKLSIFGIIRTPRLITNRAQIKLKILFLTLTTRDPRQIVVEIIKKWIFGANGPLCLNFSAISRDLRLFWSPCTASIALKLKIWPKGLYNGTLDNFYHFLIETILILHIDKWRIKNGRNMSKNGQNFPKSNLPFIVSVRG